MEEDDEAEACKETLVVEEPMVWLVELEVPVFWREEFPMFWLVEVSELVWLAMMLNCWSWTKCSHHLH